MRKMWVEAERLGVGWRTAGREARKGRGIQNGEEMTILFRAASVLMVPRRHVFSQICIFWWRFLPFCTWLRQSHLPC
jgi:hypothetical protein